MDDPNNPSAVTTVPPIVAPAIPQMAPPPPATATAAGVTMPTPMATVVATTTVEAPLHPPQPPQQPPSPPPAPVLPPLTVGTAAATTTATATAANNNSTAPPSSISFDTLYSSLQSYHAQNKCSLTIPSSHPALGRIIDLLTNSGIESLAKKRWDDMFAELKEYKRVHGNCDVPKNNHATFTLGKWVADQRDFYKLYEQQQHQEHQQQQQQQGSSTNNPLQSTTYNPLTPPRYQQLKSLPLLNSSSNSNLFNSSSFSPLWSARLAELKSYKSQTGHCDVPLSHPSLLGVWVLNQRDAYHFERQTYGEDKVRALEEVGFNWNRWGRNRLKSRSDVWERQFERLLEYIKEHGHSNISQHDKDNEKLGKWIKNQRYEYRKYHNKGLGPSRLGRDRIDKLNEIGFQWRLRPERVPWDDRFKALVEFKQTHGHCRVPMSMPELGKWAKYTRDQYCLFLRGKKAKITQEKVDRLASIGFEESLEERVALTLGDDGMNAGLEEELHHHHHHQFQQQHQNNHVEQHTAEQQEHSVGQHHHYHAIQHQQQHPEPVMVEHHHGQEEVVAYQHSPQPQVPHHATHGEQPQQHHAPAAPVTGAVQHQVYAEHYHHGEAGAGAGHAYAGQPPPPPPQQQPQQQAQQSPQPPPAPGTFHYQHGSVHYHG